ncbi:efflux RND transporter periplasmic adaptor subunit [Rhodovarius crocodyli]|uniref:Efflux RND transporter periplasmic adaptor subunit n=1 Tax=Rhodovarius crocodyli TaxID=1979269 RepID=A0A437MEC2_9PROT|nr:efflux RND transporter periplasmic adaptor subunit [Rhodovarius crocodyli]RVT95955.1 efflux RND transporter periplasmic adaptor subunit [Rhodovarius crocodyli]
MRPSLILPVLLMLAACKADQAAEIPREEPPTPVQTAEYRPAPVERPANLTGVIRARREADLGFRAGGRIAERLVNLGDRVRQGDALARIDARDLDLALRAAEADLAAAEAQSVQAANDASRSAQLLAAGHVAPAFNDQRVAAARAARERVASAAASRNLARNRASYATLVAPADGVVTAILAEAGQVVAEGTPVLRIANPAEREILVQVPETLTDRVEDPTATASFWARRDDRLPVTLREMAAQAEPGLRTYAARFTIPNAPDWAQLGMTATVHLPARGGMAARIPLSALHDRGQGPMVWALEGRDRLRAVPVTVLAMAETTATVTANLPEGARIIAMGPQLLGPETRVRPVDQRLASTLR